MNSVWQHLEGDSPTLHALLLRLTQRQDAADDLLQELFLKLSRATAFAGAEDPSAYAHRAAINLAMDWRRGQKRRRVESLTIEPADSSPGPHQSLEDAEETARILDAVEDLSELAREAFVLRYVQQESFERVGELIGKTAHQARGLCHAAVKQVRERLAQKQVAHERAE